MEVIPLKEGGGCTHMDLNQTGALINPLSILFFKSQRKLYMWHLLGE